MGMKSDGSPTLPLHLLIPSRPRHGSPCLRRGSGIERCDGSFHVDPTLLRPWQALGSSEYTKIIGGFLAATAFIRCSFKVHPKPALVSPNNPTHKYMQTRMCTQARSCIHWHFRQPSYFRFFFFTAHSVLVKKRRVYNWRVEQDCLIFSCCQSDYSLQHTRQAQVNNYNSGIHAGRMQAFLPTTNKAKIQKESGNKTITRDAQKTHNSATWNKPGQSWYVTMVTMEIGNRCQH